MNRQTPLALAFAAVLASTVPVLAQTPTGGAPALEGRTVRGADGAALGVVERVVRHADGRPVQVLVRPKGVRSGGPKSLAYGAVHMEKDEVSVPLTKPEFDAMPSLEPTS
jgi:hypothetical protein